MSDWFAAQVWTGREHACAQHLGARGYDVFLPCYRDRRRWSDRIKVVEKALFAGYVFYRVSAQVIGKVITAPGVIRIVGNANGPLPVSSVEIETLQRAVNTCLPTEPWEYLAAGHTA